MASDPAATAVQAQLQTDLLRAQHGLRQDRRLLPTLRGRLQEGQCLELPRLSRHCIENKVPTAYFRNDKRVRKAVHCPAVNAIAGSPSSYDSIWAVLSNKPVIF